MNPIMAGPYTSECDGDGESWLPLECIPCHWLSNVLLGGSFSIRRGTGGSIEVGVLGEWPAPGSEDDVILQREHRLRRARAAEFFDEAAKYGIRMAWHEHCAIIHDGRRYSVSALDARLAATPPPAAFRLYDILCIDPVAGSLLSRLTYRDFEEAVLHTYLYRLRGMEEVAGLIQAAWPDFVPRLAREALARWASQDPESAGAAVAAAL